MSDRPRIKIAFLTRSLEAGGAERQLIQLALGLAARGHSVLVLSMYPGGLLKNDLTNSSVELIELRKRGRWDLLGFWARLKEELKTWGPQVLYSFLDVPNLLSVTLKKSLKQAKIVWGIRDATSDMSSYSFFPRFVHGLTYYFSRFSDGIVSNSIAAQRLHQSKGMSQCNFVVIPNGIDTDKFSFQAQAREKIRFGWQISDQAFLVGMAARLDPVKDHQSFLQTAALIRKSKLDTRFVCIGGGPKDYQQQLESEARRLGLDDALKWAGEVEDMPAAYSACDLVVNASSNESFPNVVAEAMACERPLAITDAGDSAKLVGPLGKVVPPRDPEALAEACMELIDRPSTELEEIGRCLRERILGEYSVDKMVSASEAYLCGLTLGETK